MDKQVIVGIRDLINKVLQEGYDVNGNFVFCAYTFFPSRYTLKEITKYLESYGFEVIMISDNYHVLAVHDNVNDPVSIIDDLRIIGIDAELCIDTPYAYKLKRR